MLTLDLKRQGSKRGTQKEKYPKGIATHRR